jgi:opacity protein-like surface antigen
MKKRLLLVAVVLMVVALAGSAALALAPMGPPTPGLKKGEFRVGFDYAYSEMDIKGSWSDDVIAAEDYLGVKLPRKFKDTQSNIFAANLGYGLMDGWEAFARLGAANLKNDDWEFSGDYGFLYGFGTKVTWAKQENLDWGALFQINWLKSKETFTYTVDDEDVDVDFKVKAYEIQIALGPTWKASDALSIYGGPFLHFLSGDVDASVAGTSLSLADIKQDSVFGGYVGAQLNIKPNPTEVTNSCYLFGELQFTGAGWAFGTGIGYKF